MSSTNNQNTIDQLLERVALLEGAVSPLLLSLCAGAKLIGFQARERGLEARVHHGAIQELSQFADGGLRGLTKFVNDQAEELSRMQDELEWQKEKRRRLKVRLERMERLFEELSLRMEATRCRCGCAEEEERLDYINVENLLEGFGVDDNAEHLDPLGAFRERGQVSDRGRGLRRRGRITPGPHMM